MSDFIQALRLQGRVIHAFILRETRTRFGRSKLGYFWAFFEPMAYIVSLIGTFYVLNRTIASPIDIRLFFFTGIIPWLLFSRGVGMAAGAIDANRPLLDFPQVKVIDVVIARIILDFSTIFIVSIIYLLLFHYLIYPVRIASVGLVIVGLMVSSLLGMGFGLIGSAIKLYFNGYDNIQSIFMRVLFFTSGIFFFGSTLPAGIGDWLVFNPVLHLVEWVRDCFFYDFRSDFYTPYYPIVFSLVLIFIGLAAERVTRHKIRE